MTKYKLYRIRGTGMVVVEIVEAYDWYSLFSTHQYNSSYPIFKVEVYDGQEVQK